MKNTVSKITLTLLLTSMLTLAFNIQSVKASGTIYIMANGRVEPSTAPIHRRGDIYTFTDNIFDEIVVERSGVTINGAGYTLQGTGAFDSKGIFLSGVSDVTIIRTNIKGFDYGVYLHSTSHSVLSGNNVTNNMHGFRLDVSSDNSIYENNVASNWRGIMLLSSNYNTLIANNITANTWMGIYVYYSSSHNRIIGNNITANDEGIFLSYSSCHNTVAENNITASVVFGVSLGDSSNYNSIFRNLITDNQYGVMINSSNKTAVTRNTVSNSYYGISFIHSGDSTVTANEISNNQAGVLLATSSENNTVVGNNILNNYFGLYQWESSNNFIFHNNFKDNFLQVYDISWHPSHPGSPSINTWDDDYPSGGNYWSDYAGVDQKVGPNQDQPGRDGIGDTPYTIDANNQDRYPLMNPWIERKVGVKIGDWAKYGNFVFKWSSNDPRQHPPTDIPEWMNVTIQNIVGTNITFQLVMHYQTSAEDTTIGWMDVSTSYARGQMGMPLLISADLKTGDSLYQTFSPVPINETILREYVGVIRETNHLSCEWSFQFINPNEYFNGSLSAYWDRATGILTEYMLENVFVDETLNYVTSTSLYFQIVDTNIWRPQIPTTIDELKTEVEELGFEGEIDNQGIINSLISKLDVAQKLVGKEKIEEAKTILEEDFIPQVQNLSGIHITVEAADILIKSAEHILSHL